MPVIANLHIEAIVGSVPRRKLDNLSECAKLFGEERAAAIVKKTGFSIRRVVEEGQTLFDLVLPAAREAMVGTDPETIGAVIVVTFTAPNRYPAAAMTIRKELNLPESVIAFDISLACSGYPYGLLVAGQLAASTGKRVLLVDGDIQSAYLNREDSSTMAVMGDGASATLLSAQSGGEAVFGFLNAAESDALVCPAAGPVAMRGQEVFYFVMTKGAAFIKDFVADYGGDIDAFVPHQANLYMVKQLANWVGLGDKLLTSCEEYGNPGSASLPITLAAAGDLSGKTVLLSGFGAGLSVANVCLTMPPNYRHSILEVCMKGVD